MSYSAGRACLGSSLLFTLSLLIAQVASAQPVVTAFQSQGMTFGFIDDLVFLGSTQTGLPSSYSKSDSGSGHLSDPFGAGWDVAYQDCIGDAAVDATLEGPLAPFISTSASSSGTQNGTTLASSTLCTAEGSGVLDWQFAFYSPTFWGIGGQSLPVAFTISGVASTSGTCSGFSYCSPVSEARLEISQIGVPGGPQASALALETGPNVDALNAQLQGDFDGAWRVFANAVSTEGGAENVLGASGNGSSVAAVNGIQLNVDFGQTEALIKIANPGLSQTTIDQGLADLVVLVSPGVDVGAFAPQFAPAAPVPMMSLPALLATILSLAACGWLILRLAVRRASA